MTFLNQIYFIMCHLILLANLHDRIHAYWLNSENSENIVFDASYVQF